MRWSGCAMALLLGSSPVIAGCAPEGGLELGLSVTPGELATADAVLEVEVHRNGCVVVHRPGHWREPGDFAAQADASLLALRDQLSRAGGLQHFDPAALQAELEVRDQARGEVFLVEDADLFALHWKDAAGVPRQLRMAAVFQYAERHPDHPQLAELARVVNLLQQQARRADLQSVPETQP